MQATAHITFDDEFNALSLWSPSNPSGTWATTFWYQDPNGNGSSLPSNGEQEWYINSNYGPTAGVTPWTDSNGVLTITAAPASSAVSSLINGYGYTSGEINTYHSFAQTYGYFEMRAQLPKGQGFWPAFWLLPESGAWPPELDVMEVLGSNTNLLYSTIHTTDNGNQATGNTATVADMSTGYHTYGVDWEADYITFYFDGQAIYKATTPSDMHQPMYMIANLAAGGNWPGSVIPGSVGQMNIDYVRAYASGAAAGVTSTPTSSTTTTVTPVTSATAPAPSSTASSTPATTTSSTTGQTFTSDNNGDHWTGTAGNDTFYLGRGGDVVTGNGGADTFKVAEVPWGHAEITDFSAQDVLDLSGVLASVGYTGSNPVADGHLQFVSDGAGGTQVWLNTSGLPVSIGTWEIAELDHVAPSSLSISNGLITEGAAAASAPAATGGGSTTSTATSTPASATGQTFTSDNNGDHWTGTAGNDVFNVGRGGDYLTGNGGADTFKFAQLPWTHAEITDFSSHDSLDLTGLFASLGYTGSNPLSDGHLQFVSDGNGGTQVWFNTSGLPVSIGAWEIAALDHVSPSSLGISGGVITESGSSTATSGGATSSSTSTSSSTGVAGQTFTSDNNGDHWTGTAGNDTFYLGRGGDVVTGNGGSDTFVFHETPWTGGHITDFGAGDTLDLSGMLAIDGYTSGDAVAQGYLAVTADAAGEAQVWSHLAGQWWLVDTLDHVAPTSLHVNGAFITG